MSVRITTCPICGEQTGVYEAGRIESVAANKCKCPPAPAPRTVTEEQWGFWNLQTRELRKATTPNRRLAEESLRPYEIVIPVRVTLTYTVPEGM